MKRKAGGSRVVLVLSTVSSLKAAQSLGKSMVDARLAACVNCIPVGASIYRWKGKVEKAKECLMIFKTAASRSKALVQALRAAHPYALPEIVVIPVRSGLPAYLNWVVEESSAIKS